MRFMVVQDIRFFSDFGFYNSIVEKSTIKIYNSIVEKKVGCPQIPVSEIDSNVYSIINCVGSRAAENFRQLHLSV